MKHIYTVKLDDRTLIYGKCKRRKGVCGTLLGYVKGGKAYWYA